MSSLQIRQVKKTWPGTRGLAVEATKLVQFGRLHDAFLPRHLDKRLEMAKLHAAIYHGYHNLAVN